MGKLIRINENAQPKPSIFDQIQAYAASQNYVKKEGGYYDRNGKYVGSIFLVGKLGGIDMLEHRG